MDQNAMKKAAALAAITYIPADSVIGVGTGSTVDYFIEGLATVKHRIEAAVASSVRTAERLQALGIRVLDLTVVNDLPLYVDGADEVDHRLYMLKGGGGALTREKILATVAKQVICIADQSKYVKALGEAPVVLEVIPMARSFVARQIVRLQGNPVYREGFVTDNGNVLLDVYNLKILEPIKLEETLNNIEGVVAHGLFAKRPADLLLLATEQEVKKITV